MPLQLKLSHKALILVAVPLAFEILFVATLYLMLARAEATAAEAERSKLVMSRGEDIYKSLYEGTGAVVSYYTTRQPLFLNRFEEVIAHVDEKLKDLKELTAGHKEEERLYKDVSTAARAVVVTAREVVQSLEDGPSEFPLSYQGATTKQMKRAIQKLHEYMQKFTAFQQQVRQVPQAQSQARQAVNYMLAFGIIANVIIAFLLAIMFNRSATTRLARLMDNTRNLAGGKPLAPPLSGGDEIAHLDTTFHEMARALEEAALKERELARMKQEFLAMVSHDLRTPLTATLVYLNMLLERVYGPLSKPAIQGAEVARDGLNHVMRLVDDLLDIERMEHDKLKVHAQPTSLLVILQQSLEVCRNFAQRKQISIELVEERDIQVLADSNRIAQVIINLISNAIKFSPEKSTITLAYAALPAFVEVQVKDQGRGIPPEMQQEIFERFKQVSAADATEKRGTGLGLAICKAIVEAHDGTIGVVSEPGKGSCFWFRIPLARI